MKFAGLVIQIEENAALESFEPSHRNGTVWIFGANCHHIRGFCL